MQLLTALNNMANISVVIPVFNHVDGLERAVQSAVNQSVEPFEVIVVNDGSALSNARYIQQVCDTHSLRLINHEINKGVSQARNTGIQASNGGWIAFLDADDYWEVDFLESALYVAQTHSADLVGTAYRYLRVGGVVSESVINANAAPNSVFQISDYFQYALSGDLPFTCSSVLLSRNTIGKCGLFDHDLTMGEDQVFWNRIIQSGARSFVLNRRLSNYDLSGSESACNSASKAASWEFVKKIHDDSADSLSPYKQPFIDKSALKAFAYAMLYKRFDLAEEISVSEMLGSRINRLLMRALLLLPGRFASSLVAIFYKQAGKR